MFTPEVWATSKQSANNWRKVYGWKTICQLQLSSKMDKDQTLPSPSARTQEPRPAGKEASGNKAKCRGSQGREQVPCPQRSSVS